MEDDSLSDFSSVLSSLRSPTPVMNYPSPVSSQGIESAQDRKLAQAHKRFHEEGDQPIARKRRRAEPKPRTTEYLNLIAPHKQPLSKSTAAVDRLLKVLQKRRKIVVVVGAGISVSAGSMLCQHCHISTFTKHIVLTRL